MLHFKLNTNNVVIAVSDKLSNDTISRSDFTSRQMAEEIAAQATEVTKKLHIVVDRGNSRLIPYDVIEAPAVGNPVSYAFNGDYYPCGEITAVSPTLKKIVTSTGHEFYRSKQTGNWKLKGTFFSLIKGHIDKRNPSF